MSGDRIPERDWRHYKEVRDRALQRFCQRALDDCRALADDRSQTAHERYLAVYQLIQDRDRDIDRAFDGLSRYNAVWSLIVMRRLDLLADDEIAGFSDEVQDALRPIEPARRE
jgi:hypothetical protein